MYLETPLAEPMIYRGIYLGWVGFENLGDEAMYELCRHRFPHIHWSAPQMVERELKSDEFLKRSVHDLKYVSRMLIQEVLHQPRLRSLATRELHRVARKMGRERAILGGGTLINRSGEALNRYIRVRAQTRSLVPVFGTGVCCPEFWSAEPGWRDCRQDWVAAMAELPVVGVRGPRSKELLDDAGAENVVVSGDPAVLFHLPYSREKPRERQNASLRIGVNASDCHGQQWGNLEKTQESLAGLVRWLNASKHQVIFMPVEPRDVAACVDVARRAGMTEPSISTVYSTAQVFLKQVETLDLLVAVKLHAGILSAAANVPFVLLQYQPKCLDFALSLNWEEFAPRTDMLTDTVLIDRVSLLIDQLAFKKQELCDRMCDLMHRFDSYCRNIAPLFKQAVISDPGASPMENQSL